MLDSNASNRSNDPRPSEPDEYGLAEPSAPRRPAASLPEPRRQEPILTVELPPDPPQWPFYQGIFGFPWRLKTLAVWLLMSIGLTLGLLGAAYCWWLADQGGMIAVRCLALPVCWVLTFSISYASACCLVVIQQTAEGYDIIEDWPMGDWREWLFSLQFTFLPFVVGLLVGVVVRLILRLFLPVDSSMLVLGIGCLLYPFFLLSVLEAGSPLTFISPPIWRSLKSRWWAWMLVYIEMAVPSGLWLLLVVSQFPKYPWATILIAAPLLTALWLIGARLLGRLVSLELGVRP